MIMQLLRFAMAGFSWLGWPLTVVGALEPEESSEFNGQRVTDFGLQAHDGRLLDISDFRGMPIIVEFFASLSSESLAQLTELIEIHKRYANQGLAIFALAVDPFETPETVKNVHLLIVTMRLPFPVGGATRELANDYHYKGVPATIVLDCEGKIARIFFGFHEAQRIEPIIKKLLATTK
jgi:cytochrome c biogenesis protein CcmG/thiol:disulfide interchange protein DsbE